MLLKQEKRQKRHKRIRARIFGSKDRPRLCVFKSAKHLYAQLINDEKGEVIAQVSDLQIKKTKVPQKELAKEVGKSIAAKAKELKIERVVFDRGGYKYHGRIKMLAEGAREGGLKF